MIKEILSTKAIAIIQQEMSVKQAKTPEEYEAAKLLLVEFWREHACIEGEDATGEALDDSLDEIERECIENPYNRFLFLLYNHEHKTPDGVCYLGYFDIPRLESKCHWVILDFYIAPRHRSCGQGRKLVEQVMAFIATQEKLHFEVEASSHVDNKGGLKFWNRIGFQTLSRTTFSDRTISQNKNFIITSLPFFHILLLS